jgi:hypothetical protein
MKQLVLEIILIGSAMVQAEAKTLTDAVREGYEVKTASGFWVILQWWNADVIQCRHIVSPSR